MEQHPSADPSRDGEMAVWLYVNVGAEGKHQIIGRVTDIKIEPAKPRIELTIDDRGGLWAREND